MGTFLTRLDTCTNSGTHQDGGWCILHQTPGSPKWEVQAKFTQRKGITCFETQPICF
jgi:hypothetical protein